MRILRPLYTICLSVSCRRSIMYAKVYGATIDGLDGVVVTVEVDIVDLIFLCVVLLLI